MRENSAEEIVAATRELLQAMVEANNIRVSDVASAIFTTTSDVNAEFPAYAAREMGWTEVPLLCGHEMDVPGSLQRCIRILLHINTDKTAEEIKHVYINGAEVLRRTRHPAGSVQG